MKKKVIPSNLELPEDGLERTEHIAPQGASFYWTGEVLIHLGGTNYFMTKALSQLKPSIKESFKQQIINFTEQGDYATSSYVSFFSTIQSILNLNPGSAFDLNWIAQALKNSGFRRQKKMMIRFLLQWQERDSNVISQDVLSFLNDAAPYRNGPRNVLSDDPEKSWLTDEEYDGLLSLTWNNYHNGISSTQATLVKLLSLQYARRPIQIAYLKVGDIRGSDNQGVAGCFIEFPGAKDLAAETSFRDSKPENHPLPDYLWDLCCIQLKEIKELYEHVLKIALTDEQFKKLPLFCSKKRIKEARQLIEAHHQYNFLDHLDSELLHLPKGYIGCIIAWRNSSPTFNYTESSLRKKNPKTPISPRTGRTMIVNALRMRHTRARQIARKGVPKHILSHWLGHTSERSIHAYYNDPAEEARKIDEAMAPMLAPLAMAFTGTLIDSEDQAKRASDPTSKLEFVHEGELKDVGRCGKHSFCTTTSVPVPCYRCMHFEPLVDAPHHEVLEALVQRMEAEKQLLKIGSPRNLLIPIDLSADIRAVENCITRCNFRKAERGIK